MLLIKKEKSTLCGDFAMVVIQPAQCLSCGRGFSRDSGGSRRGPLLQCWGRSIRVGAPPRGEAVDFAVFWRMLRGAAPLLQLFDAYKNAGS
jgi:hypothetical protein